MSAAGLVPVLRLAEAAGWHEHLEAVGVASANAAAKVSCVLAGMLAGADCIDDLDLLRHGGMPRLFTGVVRPRHSGRSCARSPTATCSSSTLPGPACWPDSPGGCQDCWPGPVNGLIRDCPMNGVSGVHLLEVLGGRHAVGEGDG